MKPSWQDYIDNTLLSSGYVSKAAIFGLDKNQIWAHSSGFQVTQAETKAITKAFTEPEHYTKTGMTLDTKTYTLVKSTPSYLIGKHPGGGCVVSKTNRLVIIAVWKDNVHSGSAVNLVGKLIDYLRHENF